MVCLSGGGKSLTIHLAVSIEYQRVTDRQTDRQIERRADGRTDILRQHSRRYDIIELQWTSLCSAWLSQLVLCFEHFTNKQVLVSEDFNAHFFVYHKLLTLDQICRSYLTRSLAIAKRSRVS